MTWGEKLKEHRLAKGLSQEKAAERLGVSRQAVAKWEKGQSMPSSEHIWALSRLYDVSLDELVGNRGREMPDKKILHANLTRWAIIFQMAMLNVCIGKLEPEEYGLPVWVLLGFRLVPLAACSIWMAWNLRYEEDLAQRRKNARIELGYCLLQALIALAAYRTGLRLVGGAALCAVGLGYIFFVNPRYMNRVLVKQKTRS